ncbi:hypothetical protein [Muribaculum caecicola]|uniref:Uncharacterized protein n=1 Tax=Muribaculum caecicola TaxID=3038144 RepID=A0AC61S4C4_9BACT|nr:hypothetical protein [Muribaculum caecicola]THG46973.1 hypothetical protein E5990_08010 [Muribaculum caecicola]
MLIDKKPNKEMPHGISLPVNKPIIITFLAMEKVILLCTTKTRHGKKGSQATGFFSKKIHHHG